MDVYSPLTLYKASAGSGKTFTLAVRYISYLIKDPTAYRHILAVTFTNKATAEMKQRIMSQLYGISRNLKESDSYFNAIRKLVPASYTDEKIRGNAGRALSLMLQDYGHFRVETIDSFFQSVLRGLARELQLGSNLSIELDQDAVISDAVDNLLANMEQDAKERRYVLDFVQDNIDNEKNWHIDTQLKKFSRQLFSETFMDKETLLHDVAGKPDNIREYYSRLRDKRKEISDKSVQKLIKLGENISSLLNQRGYALDTVKSTYRNLVQSCIDGTYLSGTKGTAIEKAARNPSDIFYARQLSKDSGLESFSSDTLLPLFQNALEIRDEYDRNINSYNAALKHLNELALLLAVRREINRQNAEEGRFVLADTAHLLSSLTEDDTNFVFEKTGSIIRHLMIDEFQDTSLMQWKNMGMLMHECLSQNEECLVVGDVKQSIYRWRNGDWNILNTGIEQKFASYRPHITELRSNRRSHKEIIDFNNRLIPIVTDRMATYYESVYGKSHPSLKKAYSDVTQECPHKESDKQPYKPGGSVKVLLMRDGQKCADREELAFKMIEDELDRLTEAGIRQSDITMLLRDNKEIASIASHFAAFRPEYRMVSGDAFQLDTSVSVRIIVNSLRWIADETDSTAAAAMIYEWNRAVRDRQIEFHDISGKNIASLLPEEFCRQHESLKGLPLFELAQRILLLLELEKVQGQDAYILTFLDIVKEFSLKKSSDISVFIREWDERLYKKKIPSESTDSIRLMTIHSSKGLEFHTVIIPFCDWEICKYGDKLWVEPQSEPFNGISLLPIEFSKALGNSIFSDEYVEESSKQLIDNLNLLYVAVTRPKCNMVIMSPNPPAKSTDHSWHICDFIAEALGDGQFGCNVDDDGMLAYESGNLIPSTDDGKSTSKNPFDSIPETEIITMKPFGTRARFRQSGESQKFVHSLSSDDADNDIAQQDFIDKGKLLHQLMSAIVTPDDIDGQVEAMVSQGLIESTAKASEISRLIHQAVSGDGVRYWFDGHWTVFNETSVLFRRNGIMQTRRPDRVITDGNETIVIDFKFGREKEDYLHQIQEYMELLDKMGFRNVKGYIWYVFPNKTVRA